MGWKSHRRHLRPPKGWRKHMRLIKAEAKKRLLTIAEYQRVVANEEAKRMANKGG